MTFILSDVVCGSFSATFWIRPYTERFTLNQNTFPFTANKPSLPPAIRIGQK